MRKGRKSRAIIMAEDKAKAAQQSMLPPANFTETPEFQEAVKKAASEALKGFVSELKIANSEQNPQNADRALMSTLALELAELTGQGSGRKYVAPEILRARADAADEMHKLIAKAMKEQTDPMYRLTGKCHLADRVVEPFWVDSHHMAQPTEIGWYGVPNEVMVPLNEPAKAIFKAFQASIGSTDKVVPEPKYGVTAKGLVVKNGAVSERRAVGSPKFGTDAMKGTESDPKASDNGLTIAHQNAPGRYIEKNILGTIATPARQTA